MSRAKEIADRVAGRLQGARDAVRGTGYEPLAEGREPTRREQDTYDRWLEHKDPRNAYERTAFASLPRELEAEMERAGQAAAEADAVSQHEANAAAASCSRAVIADRIAGVLQGAADAVQGVTHKARAWHGDRDPEDRAAAARARWQAGLPARNTYERDAYASLENQVAAGMTRLGHLGRQASRMEAAMAAEAETEAGS